MRVRAAGAFDATTHAIDELKAVAAGILTLKADADAKKADRDAAKNAYDTASAAANANDEHVTTMQAARTAACAGLESSSMAPDIGTREAAADFGAIVQTSKLTASDAAGGDHVAGCAGP